MESAKYINQKGVMVETKIKATIEAGKRNIMRDAKRIGWNMCVCYIYYLKS